jgi:hypothetical protein
VDIATEPGRGIGRDIGRGEAVEHKLDAFISKRHEQRVKTERAPAGGSLDGELAPGGDSPARGEQGRLAVVVSAPGARLPGAGNRVRAEGRRPGDSQSNRTEGGYKVTCRTQKRVP